MRLVKDWGLALLVGFCVYLLVSFFSSSGTPRDGAAPPFELANVAGGTVRLEDLRGKPVVVNFWGTWCPPCRHEIPAFAAYATDNPDVPVLGIAVRSGAGASLAKQAAALGITYPVLESTAAVIQAYGVEVYPTTFVLKPDGGIATVFAGGITRAQLESAVDAAR